MKNKLCVWAIAALLVAGSGCCKENDPKGDKNSEQPGGGDADNDSDELQGTDIDIFPELEYDELVYVEGGTFLMGAQKSDPNAPNYDSDAGNNESPVHAVTLDSYYIGKYAVTQGLWKKVMGENPSWFNGDDNLPVEYVSWDHCQEFIARLNEMTGKNFRLPTEAEWEYAARGGQQDEYTRTKGQSGTCCKYAGSNDIDEVAWYYTDSAIQTCPVGTKTPNALGLYDMSGNVYEWCGDWYNSIYYSSTPSKSPTGPDAGSFRVLRGGGWSSNAGSCRVSFRDYGSPGKSGNNGGLRLVLPF